MMANALQSEAMRYIRNGFRVIPLFGATDKGCGCGDSKCKPRDWGKHEPPATEGKWKEGYIFRPNDFFPEDNIALAMGPWNSGLWIVALDFDLENGSSPDDLMRHRLPATLEQKTPRGIHRIYTVPEYTPLGNWVDVLGTKDSGASLDLRYARGRIVAPPSRGATGRYEWTRRVAPEPLPRYVITEILNRRLDRGLKVDSIWARRGKDP